MVILTTTIWPVFYHLSSTCQVIISFDPHNKPTSKVKQIFLIPILQKSKLTMAEMDHCVPISTLTSLLVTASWFHAQLKDCFAASSEGWCGHIIKLCHWAVSWSFVRDFWEVLKERMNHFFTLLFPSFTFLKQRCDGWYLAAIMRTRTSSY